MSKKKKMPKKTHLNQYIDQIRPQLNAVIFKIQFKQNKNNRYNKIEQL